MYKREIANAWRTGKRILGGAWNSAVKIAGQLDHGISISKRLFGALSNSIEDFAPSGASRGIMNAFASYDTGRMEALNGYNNVRSQYNSVKAAVPEINFD